MKKYIKRWFAVLITLIIMFVGITSVDADTTKVAQLTDRTQQYMNFQINLDQDLYAIRNLYAEADTSTKRIMSVFYGLVEAGRFNGESKEEAIKSTSERMIRREALYLKAVSLGFEISDSEALVLVNEVLSDIKRSDDYPIFLAIREESGISDEEFINNETVLKKISGSIDAYYNHVKSVYMEENELSSLSNEAEDDWDAYWEVHVQDVIRESANLPSIRLIKRIASNYDSTVNQFISESETTGSLGFEGLARQ